MAFKRHPVAVATRVRIVFGILALLAIVEVANMLTGRRLGFFGIHPREVASLPGIFLAPFLHWNLVHFTSNAVPLAVFSFLMMMHGAVRFLLSTLLVMIVGGGLVWLFGSPGVHAGASGVIYGYFAYLVAAGFVAREFKLLLVSLAVMVLYGGMVWGVLPGVPFVSWESHLFGAVAGILAARIWGRSDSDAQWE